MTERQVSYLHLLGLFAVAIALRLLYLQFASDYLGFDRFSLYYPDSRLYLMLGDHILTWEKMGGYGLLRVGPGYGLILAGIKAIFGSDLIWPILFNIIMGGLAPLLVYILAYQLLRSRVVALLAGGFSAISLTSVSLSCHILTDQPYFTLQVAALACFAHGYLTGRIKWFLMAGILSGCAAYVRPAGQTWPYIFIFLSFVLPVAGIYTSRRDLIRRAGITGAVMLVMILGWSVRNYVIHDLFTFGTNGMLTVRSCLVAEVAERNRGEGKSLTEYRAEWEEEDGDRSDDYAAAYGKARERILREFQAHPGAMMRQYFHNVVENMIAANYSAQRQIPQIRDFMAVFNRAVRNWIGYLIFALTIGGLVLLVKRQELLPAWLLGVTYLNFSVLLGASIWQGSRLHYPAEMAWSIVVAFLIVEGVRYFRLKLVDR